MTLRDQYENAVRDLAERAAAMRRNGVPAEAIARAMHAERRRLAVHFKALTPEPYRTVIAERTTRVYGDPQGPTIAFLRERGRSWEAIIESATRPGPSVIPVAASADQGADPTARPESDPDGA
ncbi:cell wall-binding protein [Methylobacterium indicum]|uniref:cell wall-binding protein n=1 Tax=Methylobacterium indicum TaxID=1775910 RepID=UPI000A7B8015|nr:cell wall-binding protein [Methylobacterium indicum]